MPLFTCAAHIIHAAATDFGMSGVCAHIFTVMPATDALGMRGRYYPDP